MVEAKCGAERNPTGSPTTASAGSPSNRRRRRRRSTLRKLLKQSPSRQLLHPSDSISANKTDLAERREGSVKKSHHTLGDLFLSSPQPLESDGGAIGGGGREIGVGGAVAAARFGSGVLRYRLLRRIWRPALVSIPE